MGLDGVLIGALASVFVMIYCWKPYFVFKYGFESSCKPYIYKNIKLTAIFCLIWALVTFISNHMSMPDELIARMSVKMVQILVFSTILATILYLTDSGARQFLSRIKKLVKH